MNGSRSDASTSTDDVKERPLCLFYFTHPFGVLSPEPPTVAAAPPHIARAFLNMEPVSPFTFWGSATAESYNTASSESRPGYELSVTRTRRCTLELGARDSLSSSLFSGDASSCRSTDYPRRLVPYNRILPPLRLPSPRDTSDAYSSDDLWPKKCLNPGKFSLPPIEIPVAETKALRSSKSSVESGSSPQWWGGAREWRGATRLRLGVRKPRRAARLADVRRVLATLMRRTLKGGAERGVSPALRDALSTIREAWAEPRSLFARCGAVIRGPPARAARPMLERALPPPAGASPGLLRRRYSVPETIMRKYRLAQQRSDTEETPTATECSPQPRDGCCSPCEAAHRFARRDRELMRKSALLRRLWGRSAAEPCRSCCRCGEPPPRARETRSLDGSRCELRPLSAATASVPVPPAAGWATPKRQRLDSPRDFRGSDEMLRAAMRNSYDRAEESRHEHGARDSSDCCTYRSHRRDTPPAAGAASDHAPLTDAECPQSNIFVQYSDRSSDVATLEIKSSSGECRADTPTASDVFTSHGRGNDPTPPDTSDTYSASLPTTMESHVAVELTFGEQMISSSARIDGRISEGSGSVQNDDTNLLPYDKPLTIDTPSYELLEIIVSETLSTGTIPVIGTLSPECASVTDTLKAPPRSLQAINIDEYVSNILVESLNSLTDQLESMTASMGSDRKISIVEKEIKVKLQNTGVNTIVHLSPTSNNQIIFGNEELCHAERRDACNNLRKDSIREERALSAESNNNEPAHVAFDLQHDDVNHAVLQQIQKLFQDELHKRDTAVGCPSKLMPEISHVQVSNVDVYIDDNSGPGTRPVDTLRLHAARSLDGEAIAGVGAGNYFPGADDTPVVPRFSAFPHTDSMEVNTSSSDDAEFVGSDCTSLVDSLDDPNSPRSALLRKSFNGRRSELVRSAIDVLDLLPENVGDEQAHARDKGESFFIRIKDDNSDGSKENVNVADHMPEKIKQRLYRRHRKRELRMECARRSRLKQMKREVERQRHNDAHRSRKEAERECLAIVNALIDDAIAKTAQEEYKCMRIKHKPSKMVPSKSDDNVATRNWKKDLQPIETRIKPSKNSAVRFDSSDATEDRHRANRAQIRGKLSLKPAPDSNDRGPKRVYQKSEIREGNKCIEILEILEYVNASPSSPETTTSDENQNHCYKNKKSRIPVPVHERTNRPTVDNVPPSRHKASSAARERNYAASGNRLIADMVLQALGHEAAGTSAEPPRRAEMRSRSNSLLFKRTFDIIPEERSSLSLESGAEDASLARRASAPGADTRSAGTSPIVVGDAAERALRLRNQTTMTSPSSRSTATSPLHGRAWHDLVRHDARASLAEGIPLSVSCAPLPLPHRTASSVSVE